VRLVTVEVRLFGCPEILSGGHPVKLHSSKAMALFAYLVLEARRLQPRDYLAALLWPNDPSSQSRHSLRQALYSLRKTLGDSVLDFTDDAVCFTADPCIQIDALAFDRLTRKATPDLRELRRAVELHKGILLEGINQIAIPEFEEWLELTRQGFENRYIRVLQDLIHRLFEQGDLGDALPYAERLVYHTPLDEQAHRYLMKIYARLSNLDAVRKQYEQCTTILDSELGLDPELETRTLFYELMTTRYRPRHNLPTQTMPLIGREAEVGKLIQYLQSSDVHLVTILAIGGMGKTRLALEVAQRLVTTFIDGVFFIPLVDLNSAEEMVFSIVQHIGLQFSGGAPLEQQLIDYLSTKKLLLLLDNFDSLACKATLIPEILATSPHVKILVTSRERLALSSELVFTLEGMDIQGSDTTEEQSSSVHLFLAALQRVQPNFSPSVSDLANIGWICRYVQGTPLAILLAAAWSNTLVVEEIVHEISKHLEFLEIDYQDLPLRHRSMKAVIDSSWAKLSDDEKQVFASLSVFQGGFTRQAAEQIAGASPRILGTLISKSFLQLDAANARYTTHELLRHFAFEYLKHQAESEGVLALHSTFFLEMLRQLEPALKDMRQMDTLHHIDADFDNIRQAWQWAIQKGNAEAIDNALDALYVFCEVRSYYAEGVDLFTDARRQLADLAVMGRLDTRAVRLWSRGGHYQLPDSESRVMRALHVAQDKGQTSEIAFCHATIGIVAINVGAFDLAQRHLDEAIRRYYELGDLLHAGQALNRVGYCHSLQGDLDLAYSTTLQSLNLIRSAGNNTDSANSLLNLGYWTMVEGRYQQSQAYFEEVLTLARQANTKGLVVHSSTGLGLILLLQGYIDRSGELLDTCLKTAQEANYRVTRGYALAARALLTCLEGDYAAGKSLAETSKTYFSNVMGTFLANWALSLAYCGLNDFGCAALPLREAVGICAGWGAKGQGAATWLLASGACLLSHSGRQFEATAALGLAFSHPLAATGWLVHYAPLHMLRENLASQLGTEAFAVGWEQGSSRDVNTLLDNLNTVLLGES
jgi:DNA-binding SARP family transcriptional activator/predicted ATPase